MTSVRSRSLVACTIANLADLFEKVDQTRSSTSRPYGPGKPVANARKRALAKLAAEINAVLVNPDTGYANVTEWSGLIRTPVRARFAM
jgi:hypothetical protein